MSNKERETAKDKMRGCLIGGAIGDALGYAVEFMSENRIFSKYGPDGITEYELADGKALISDDTQMTLFTAVGLLVGETRAKMRGISANPSAYAAFAYTDWYITQTMSFDDVDRGEDRYYYTWLLDVPELFNRRAPGVTCMSSLSGERVGSTSDYIRTPANNSKGCGGVMRVAPLALMQNRFHADWDMEAAQIAAVTHGHSLGYMPAAVLNHIIASILDPGNSMSLKETVIDARDSAAELFQGDKHIGELNNIIDLAVELSENEDSNLHNIRKLGEGWVAEETLAIAIYCALKYRDDFSKAIITAVNHNGDSDSTGAVTGNILGAWTGYNAIEDKWKKNLELHDVILEIADDLNQGCLMEEFDDYRDLPWECKYISLHRYKEKL